MADYIYLLENRLSAAQQHALGTVRTVARSRDLTVFLTGGAVRDLTGGGSVRDLDVTVQGDATKLRKDLEKAGATIVGEHAPAQVLYLLFPGGIRAEVGSAVSVQYPKPGKPKYEPSTISDDLRRRDFTANAMALSLNEGSYGLLMDPLNGTADIENRELRLVSNYGFIDDPSRLVRAARLISRLGWQMEERTRARYDTAKAEGYISALSPWNQGYELEEIFYEEDPLRVMRALETEGWMPALSTTLGSAKVNTTALDELRDRQGQLQTQGIVAPIAAIAFPLLVAKLAPKDLATLKASFARPGFVREIEALEAETREIQTRFASKEAASPSQVWKMLHATEPALVLSMAYSSKSAAVQGRLKTFISDSPTARQKIPYALLQEMRITPDLPAYHELLDKLFFELMDNRLQTTEEMKAYLSPYSPPAPPPPINLRRAKAKKEARPSRAKGKKAAAGAEAALTVVQQEELAGVETGLLQPGELTKVDQGTSPTPPEDLAGVAPLCKEPASPTKTTKASVDAVPESVKAAKRPAAIEVAAASPQVPVLSAKPAPLPKKEAARTTPHPIAAKEIAGKPSSMLPGAGRLVKRSNEKTPADKVIRQIAARGADTTKAAAKVPAKAAPTKRVPAKKAAPTKSAAPVRKAKAIAVPPVRGRVQSSHKNASAKKPEPVRAKVAPVKVAAKKALPARKSAPSKVPAKKSVAVSPAKRVVASGKDAPVKAAAQKVVAGKSVVKGKRR